MKTSAAAINGALSAYRDGNRIELLCCGAEFFPALESAIDAASIEVRLETYIFANDESGCRIAAALMRAVSRGARVLVAYDGFGSRDFIGPLEAELRRNGVDVVVFRPEHGWLHLRRNRLRRLHRKLAVIDGRVAFIGGINLIDDLNMPEPKRPRFDFAVRVQGPLLQDVLTSSQAVWSRLRKNRTNPEPPAIAALTERNTADHRAAFVCRDNLLHRRDIEREYLAAINAAKQSIVIANAYFFPGRIFRRAIVAAALRGVHVTLLLQGRQEYVLQHYATRALYGTLLEAGVEIHEYQDSFLHAKVAVIDRQWATVGSSNIDPFSLLLAREANVFVRDNGFAQALETQLRVAIERSSRRLQQRQWSTRPLVDRVLTWIFYGIARALMTVLGYGRH